MNTISEIGFRKIGEIQPRAAVDIVSSPWSIGAETMDRDYTVYANWREYLAPLGIKKARLQAGWSKTEREPGVYDWRWLDEIIPDMHDQGVTPWMCLCYGNAAYQGAGANRISSRLPTEASVLGAWERFVRSFVARYGSYITEWEIWNEPNGGRNSADEYAAFFVRTAKCVRDVQPDARILALALAHIPCDYARQFFEVLRHSDILDLVDEVTYHPYAENPDSIYDGVAELRSVVQQYAPHATIRQGENGAPSEQYNGGALRMHPWTELSHSKWALRRLLGDLGRDIPSSYFCIMDMRYDHGWKDGRATYDTGEYTMHTNGVLKANPDRTVAYAKSAYKALQNLAAIFDDTLTRISEFAYETNEDRSMSLFAYRNKASEQSLVCYWLDGEIPSDSATVERIDLSFPVARFRDPVLLDLRLGDIYAIPANRWKRSGTACRFSDMPVADSPLIIADKSLSGAAPV